MRFEMNAEQDQGLIKDPATTSVIGSVVINASSNTEDAALLLKLTYIDIGGVSDKPKNNTVGLFLLPHEMRVIGRSLLAAAEFMEGQPDA